MKKNNTNYPIYFMQKKISQMSKEPKCLILYFVVQEPFNIVNIEAPLKLVNVLVLVTGYNLWKSLIKYSEYLLCAGHYSRHWWYISK